jgi:hypothetical protein
MQSCDAHAGVGCCNCEDMGPDTAQRHWEYRESYLFSPLRQLFGVASALMLSPPSYREVSVMRESGG